MNPGIFKFIAVVETDSAVVIPVVNIITCKSTDKNTKADSSD